MLKKIRLLIVGAGDKLHGALEKRFMCNPNFDTRGSDCFPYSDDSFAADVILLDGDSFSVSTVISAAKVPCIVMSEGKISEKEAAVLGAAGYIRKPAADSDCITFCSLAAAKLIFAYSTALRKEWNAKGGNDEMRDISESCGRIVPIMPTAAERFAAKKAGERGYVVAMGASTGGTDALECVIRSFPEDMPPVLVVQHMPAKFTKLYAERLDRICAVRVEEARDGMRLEKGLCLIGAGGLHMTLENDARGYYVKCAAGAKVSGHCPSVDVLFGSVAAAAGKRAVGVILTGMGADGANGLLEMHKAGAYTIGQDKDSSVVYGMPMEAYKLGACDEQRPLKNIGAAVCRALGKCCI